MKLGAWKFVFLSLILGVLAIWIGVSKAPDEKLHIIACDVGQGDGILITYQTTQILIDGGPDSKILDCLGKYIPFWDSTIEAIILTHPQIDHYGGLIEVVRRYEVENFIANALDSDAKAYSELKKEISERGIKVTNPDENTQIRYGSLYLDIVHPSSEFLAKNSTSVPEVSGANVLGSYTSKKDPNEYSIVAILSFGEFDALFTGDIIPEATPDILAGGELKDVEYIKVPHHGSKNGLTPELLKAVTPEIAVISVGAHNRYGHPHQEVIRLLDENRLSVFRTDEKGDIQIITNGEEMWVED